MKTSERRRKEYIKSKKEEAARQIKTSKATGRGQQNASTEETVQRSRKPQKNQGSCGGVHRKSRKEKHRKGPEKGEQQHIDGTNEVATQASVKETTEPNVTGTQDRKRGCGKRGERPWSTGM